MRQQSMFSQHQALLQHREHIILKGAWQMAVSITVKFPGTAYVCVAERLLEDDPSPKSHSQEIPPEDANTELLLKLTGVAIQRLLMLKASTGFINTSRRMVLEASFTHPSFEVKRTV